MEFQLQPSPRRTNDQLLSPVYGYGEYIAPSAITSGAVSTGLQYQLTRVGDLITLSLYGFAVSCTSTAPSITFTNTIPAGWRPRQASVDFPIGVVDLNVAQDVPGLLRINTNGSIVIWKTISNTGTFTSGALSGILGIHATYHSDTRFT